MQANAARGLAHFSAISNAGREQSSGIDEVNQALVSLDRTTQQNAALVEEAAAAAESLFGRAEELSNVVVISKVAKQVRAAGAHPAITALTGATAWHTGAQHRRAAVLAFPPCQNGVPGSVN